MEKLQILQLTSEELKSMLTEVVKNEIDLLKESLHPSPDELLTREQTAKIFQVDLSTLWHWTKKGKIQSYGIGHRVYYKRSEIDAALTPLRKNINL